VRSHVKHGHSCSPGFCRVGSASVPGRTTVREGHVAGSGGAALGVTPVTAHHWYHAWHAHGRAALKSAGRAGRKPRLEPKQLATIEQALRAGPRVYGFRTDRWTLPRVAAVIERLTRVRHHPGHVWRILRGLHWSLQRPARRARERDEAAIEPWKTRRWARLKKTPGASTPGSSSKTKAASRSSRSSAVRGPRAAKRRS